MPYESLHKYASLYSVHHKNQLIWSTIFFPKRKKSHLFEEDKLGLFGALKLAKATLLITLAY